MNKLDLLDYIADRGYMKQCSDLFALRDKLNNEKIVAYIGFDCTANSLHIGSLIQIMLARVFQSYGHDILVVLGGATTKIGDPSDKDKSRPIISKEEINNNKKCIRNVLKSFLNKDQTIFLDNQVWFRNYRYIDLLSDIGRHFSINRMLKFESIARRISRSQELSFLEFNYLVLQSYDFLYLNRKYNCYLQIGGSDQWGNIVSGIEIIKKIDQKETFGITTNLLLNSEGNKMGKSATGAVWLSEKKFSAFDYWQYFRNVQDEYVEQYLFYFTELSREMIDKACKDDINNAKVLLANEATKICHGEKKAASCYKKSTDIFVNKEYLQLESLPIPSNQLLNGAISLKEVLFIYKLGSYSFIKKIIRNGGVAADHKKIFDTEYQLIKFPSLISIGKKKKFIVTLKPNQ